MDLLAIYLRDHLAGATGGLELAKRAEGSNRGTAFGPPLAALRAEVEADRATLADVMGRLDIGRDQLKEGAAWAAEKAGRLKLNGRVRGYSPLSRVVELEGLTMLVSGKRAVWRTLLATHAADSRLDGVDLAGLEARASAQLARLDELRSEAVAIAFG